MILSGDVQVSLEGPKESDGTDFFITTSFVASLAMSFPSIIHIFLAAILFLIMSSQYMNFLFVAYLTSLVC